jgi:hypothetical protein
MSAPSSIAHSRRVPLDKRKRTETSCDKCKSRKQKCRKEPGQDACRYCLQHRIECLTTQPRKKRLYGSVEGLGNRLALLESLVKGLLPDADVSSIEEMRQLGTSLGIPLPDTILEEETSEQRAASAAEGDEPLSLLPDQQGQTQYIGPASSFKFHLQLQALVGPGAPKEFVLFGRNPVDREPLEGDRGDSDPRSLSTPSVPSTIDQHSPGAQRAPPAETPSFESLIADYFDNINPDFPVLHEASFREAYEQWLETSDRADPAWLCSFLCVLLLSRRVGRVTFPEDQERLWWRRVQSLLPVVIFTSSVAAVQALMLASLHLHNTNHRDACWNLTGTAIRIAFAIGLHQDKIGSVQSPLSRELRKRLWWTLYAFEQMQVSSYDRPSAIEHYASKLGSPNERIIDMAGGSPPDYCKWSSRLDVHLSSACRAPKDAKSNTCEESYVGPLSPAAGVLRELGRWKDGLPTHLRREAVDNSAPSFQRQLLLLHAKYHYIIVYLCRQALLARATSLSKDGRDSTSSALNGMSDTCTESGRALAQVMRDLDAFGKYDAVVWFDIFLTLAAGSVLVLDIVCANKLGDSEISESRILLAQLADIATRHLRNPHMPGTMRKWASVLLETQNMVHTMSTVPAPKTEATEEARPAHLVPTLQPELSPYTFQSTTNGGAYMFADGTPGSIYHMPDLAPTGMMSNPQFDRAGMGFMDYTINNIAGWNWGDLGNLLGHEGPSPPPPQ